MVVSARAEIEGVVAQLVPGGRLLRADRLRGGVSADVFRLDVTTATGEARRVVFRHHRGSAFKGSQVLTAALEYGVLAALHGVGFAVPEPFLVHAGAEDAASWLIMEWIDGTTEVGAAALPDALDQMARFLADLHAFDAAALRVPGLEPIEHPVLAVRDYLPRDRIGRDVGAALDALVPGWEPNRSVLVHGDYWPGNVIWQAGTLAAVIDWEDACLGDPLADLAAARVELACAYGNGAMERFTNSYLEATSAVPLGVDALPVWEVYVSASALATMHDWGLDPVAEAERRSRTRRFFERAAQDLYRIIDFDGLPSPSES